MSGITAQGAPECANSLDPRHNKLLSIPEGVIDAVERLTGRRVSSSAVRMWTCKGLRPVGGGPRVRLGTLRFGGSAFTTEAAIVEFAATTAGTAPPVDRSSQRAPRRSGDATTDYLDREGL